MTANSLKPISDHEFSLMKELIYDRFGINLTEQKRVLLVTRLQKQVQALGLQNFHDYYRHLVSDGTGQGLVDLVNLISTNYTYFNRENIHFDYFRQKSLPSLVAHLKKTGSKDLRIWCAAASTGEEPYMLAMILRDHFGKDYSKWDGGILATDISRKALAVAKNGVYSDEKIESLPVPYRMKYFTPQRKGEWKIREEVRKDVTFRNFNLMNPKFPFKKPFHIIFIRNVMIYFDKTTREELLKKLHNVLAPGGELFIGHSESVERSSFLFQYIQPAIYRKKD